MQKKDIIYIDVEDDITAIIGKVKASKEKIIALVPPKRIGVLQSAVNLRLLARTAENANKRLVIITHNAALASLAGSADIPVAKTLQSRPELVRASDNSRDDDDVIDGGDVPIGDHARLPRKDDTDNDESDEEELPSKIANIDIDGEATPVKRGTDKDSSKKPRVKVPDFGSFRKRMAIGISAGIVLIAFLVWAIWIAPHATVVVSARTSDVEIQTPITVGEQLQSNNAEKTLPTIVQTETQKDTIEFTPTGKKEVGEKAKGTIKLYNCSVSGNATSVQAGTYVSAGGRNYVIQSTITIPAAGLGGNGTVCTPSFVDPGVSADIQVIAEEVGPEYNVTSGTSFEVAGRSDVVAIASSDIGGGTKKTVTVVSPDDVLKAREQLARDNSEEVKETLRGKFADNVIIIEESFKTTVGEQKLEPGLDEEVTGGKATITIEMVYSMSGIVESVLDNFLKTAIEEQLGNLNDKRIYDSGAKSAQFTDFELDKDKKKATLRLSATGKVGPKIEDQQIKDIVRGKRYGEIEKELKAIDGVSDVEVNLSPFWVFTVPDDDGKITIEFKLEEDD